MYVFFSNNLETDLDNILEQYGFNEKVLKQRESQQLEQRELTKEEVSEHQ